MKYNGVVVKVRQFDDVLNRRLRLEMTWMRRGAEMVLHCYIDYKMSVGEINESDLLDAVAALAARANSAPNELTGPVTELRA